MSIFKNLKISWLSPEKIKKISFGEITNHGMLDARSLKPKLGGLFDPKIFGTSFSWECYCGKYKGKKNIGQKCERCEVVITDKNVQRWRSGHIELAVPATNMLLFKNLSSFLSNLLGITSSLLEEIIYLEAYVVLDSGVSQELKNKQIFKKGVPQSLVKAILEELINASKQKKENNEEEETVETVSLVTIAKNEKLVAKAKQLLKTIPNTESGAIFFWEDYLPFLEKALGVKIKTGSEAFLSLLQGINIEEELIKKKKESKTAQKKIVRFLHNLIKNEISLESIVLKRILVIPAGLRPVTKLKKEETTTGKETLATTQINTLYRKVILANENIKYYTSSEEKSFFGEVVINNAKRRLQKAIDQLFRGSFQKNGEVKGLMQQLSGKDGILRHYSLGKRTDYSGRAVISSSSDLSFNEIKIPVQMAIVTLRPLIIRNLLSKKIVFTIREAEELINRELNEVAKKGVVFKELNEICAEHLIIFNRAPSLHRLSMQAAYPKLTLNKTIDIHPLVTTPYNADFDGDMILTLDLFVKEEIEEARENMLTTTQIIDPKNGKVITIPKQDIVLGIYCLTEEKTNNEELQIFDQLTSIWQAVDAGQITVNNLLVLPSFILQKQFKSNENDFLITTAGKILFNQTLPSSFPFFINNLEEYNRLEDEYNEQTVSLTELNNSILKQKKKLQEGWNKQEILIFVDKVVRQSSTIESALFLDKLKNIGFDYANRFGISISPFELGELIESGEKEKIVQTAKEAVKKEELFYQQGLFSKKELTEKKIVIWQEVKEKIKELVLDNFKEKKDSSFYQIWKSGARVSSENLAQLFAMRGFVSDFRGEIIDTPILASLWEGLTPFESFILTYGMVKGLIDKALRTSESGYLARRLVEAVQETIITAEDCGSTDAILLVEENSEKLAMRMYSRVLAKDLLDEKGELLLKAGKLLEREEVKLIKKHNLLSLWVFSPIGCSLVYGLCQKCYGGDLSKRYSLIDIGTAVGIIAAQSLGEPGTQLTLRTFHTGGIAVEEDIVQQGLPKLQQILDNIKPKSKAVLARYQGQISEIDENCVKQKVILEGEEKTILYPYDNKNKKVIVSLGKEIVKGEKITTGIIDLEEYLALVGKLNCQLLIIKEINAVYLDQGIEVHEKHIEIFARAALSRVKIVDPGDSEEYLVDDIVSFEELKRVNQKLKTNNLKEISFINTVSSLKELASNSSSFLASAAFQSPLKCLINYSIYNPLDEFKNPKARLIVSQLPPVGKGFLEIENYKAKFKTKQQ